MKASFTNALLGFEEAKINRLNGIVEVFDEIPWNTTDLSNSLPPIVLPMCNTAIPTVSTAVPSHVRVT